MNKIAEALANLNCVHGLHYNADCKMCAILSKTAHVPCNITATEILIRQAEIAEMDFLFKRFWAGRPKRKCINQTRYHFQFGRAAYVSTILHPNGIDWRGLV